jgi:hypothetical protein
VALDNHMDSSLRVPEGGEEVYKHANSQMYSRSRDHICILKYINNRFKIVMEIN